MPTVSNIPDLEVAEPDGPITPEAPGERNALDRAITKAGSVIAWFAFLAMSISVFEVIMRYGFDSPTSWVHESVVFIISVVFALGGPVTLAKNKHIRVRVLYDTVRPGIKIWFDRFNDFVTLAFCTFMSYAAYTMFWSASHNPFGLIQLERSGTSWNPPFPALTKGIILLALVVMSIQSLLHLIESVKKSPSTTENK